MTTDKTPGALLAKKERFGEFGRYSVAPVWTRFDTVEWFVWDAERIDEVTGGPAVIRQAETREMAMAGLDTPTDQTHDADQDARATGPSADQEYRGQQESYDAGRYDRATGGYY